MFTRTYKETPQVIRIPKNIQKDISERGFHLYKWISPEEVKLSIERDFLKVLKIIWIPLAIISVLTGLISGFNLIVFFFTISLGVFGIFVYLLFLSFRRSFLLSKSAFVILTDSSISLGWKIQKLSDISQLKNDIDTVSDTFEEKLFWESKLSWSTERLSKQIIKQLFGWYKAILRRGNSLRSRDSLQAILIIIALYTLYIAIMACVYFIGVLFLLFFGKIIMWLNTQYLIKRWHSVLKINELFGDLDRASQDIKMYKKSLEKLLWEAQNNNWKDGLLLTINEGIQNINSHAQEAILSVWELKNTITKSRYKDMFSFEVYNSWIKKQIGKPLEQIMKLLQHNLIILQEARDTVKQQIKETKKRDLQSVLELQLQRVEMQMQDVKNFIPLFEDSLKKLK